MNQYTINKTGRFEKKKHAVEYNRDDIRVSTDAGKNEKRKVRKWIANSPNMINQSVFGVLISHLSTLILNSSYIRQSLLSTLNSEVFPCDFLF
jgi:hypothetical protein